MSSNTAVSSDIETVCEKAAKALIDGKIIAYPTESSYAIGCRFDDQRGIEKIYQIKKRRHELIFPLIIRDIESLNMIVSNINNIERKLMEEFWPGALTILLDANKLVPFSLKGKRNKIAVRMSGN
ncbi:MAG: Sua5/YciO/YrdC/YwlC family protein, partial [Nitrospirae bacterium]|nr:Sua5/YciO/YrdC/YwlC family protein [Nitrospirota bacterium]